VPPEVLVGAVLAVLMALALSLRSIIRGAILGALRSPEGQQALRSAVGKTATDVRWVDQPRGK